MIHTISCQDKDNMINCSFGKGGRTEIIIEAKDFVSQLKTHPFG